MNLTFTIDMADMENANRTLEEVRRLLTFYNNSTGISLTEEPVAETTAPTGEVTLGTGANIVFSEIQSQIREKGEATLEDVSSMVVMSLPTVRAHLMNGLRTYRKNEQDPPFVQNWSPERNCVIYTAR